MKFEKEVVYLLKKKKIEFDDFEDFKRQLAENPKSGDVIPGAGGIRKIRLKSASKGKKGGFRVCYLDLEEHLILFLLFLYSKNEQENLNQEEKRELKQTVEDIKRML
jgi:hypothetical protein